MRITDNLQKLLDIFPPQIRQVLKQHPQRDNLIEVVLDLGRRPEARFLDERAEHLSDTLVTREQIDYCIDRVGRFGTDNRAGIEQTLHRISAIRNRNGDIIGLTCRVGRAVYGTIDMIRDLVETGKSILMLGRPGVGKTTALREIARVLADDLNKRVIIVDTSNEIAGDGDIPHPAIGRARRMQVASPELQYKVMIEAVENHMPQAIVIDEIGTELEAYAARSIAERGVQLVGTAHGNSIENLIKNPILCDLVGGIQSVTLGDEEARRRGSQKTVRERKAPPTFDIAVEMLERQRWVVHESVADTVDSLLRGHQPHLQMRTMNGNGRVAITRTVPPVPVHEQPLSYEPLDVSESNGWRKTGQIIPFPNVQSLDSVRYKLALMGKTSPLRLYAYGIGLHQLMSAIETLNLPIVLTRKIEKADAILALRSHLRKNADLRRMAKNDRVPIHTIKANTISQIARALQQLSDMNEIRIALDKQDRLGQVKEAIAASPI
ncbi:single-stranded DNA-binding protein [Hydrococcus rivularis NIES-593]|uniref:Single-stranded DNA-binding protein n=1 Tax=Hydrococcus rivularis NIES-593 TaxID=1921803 RepID=A0A1U7HD93_9CYAN|nr:AAA family ATPase [Hydrococcus rivularis]OKH21553.1 single-stranded DNA-binding protein [Hydrococcus rivularis NIES-593]